MESSRLEKLFGGNIEEDDRLCAMRNDTSRLEKKEREREKGVSLGMCLRGVYAGEGREVFKDVVFLLIFVVGRQDASL